MGATDSLTELYTAIRTRLLTYSDGGAAPNTLAGYVGTRLYNESPPDTATMPYLLLTIDGNPPQRDKDETRVEFQVEVQVLHSPRTNIVPARRMADLVWQALSGYSVGNATDGFIRLRVPPMPETLPAGGGEADRETVQIRIVSEGFAYWKALAPVLT